MKNLFIKMNYLKKITASSCESSLIRFLYLVKRASSLRSSFSLGLFVTLLALDANLNKKSFQFYESQ